ncbi:MAG: methyltransferase [Oscillospiraceae bacterium]|jgi:16S rRNA (guanine1207-N2)-methyltransferase|nr:methyltransferase [Oscillospiraceae bacterium]
MFETLILGVPLQFETADTLFSPHDIDRGTRALLRRAAFLPEDMVLDLGCGYGAVGITAAKLIGAERVTMTDGNPLAVRLTRLNAQINGAAGARVLQSDDFAGIDETGYTLILCHPPYHEDVSAPKMLLEKAFHHLALGGRMMLVSRRQDWYQNELDAIFGGSLTQEEAGYFVFTAEKRQENYAKKQERFKFY